MLYENYRLKMARRASFIAKLKKYRLLIIIVLAALAAAVATLLSFKGAVSEARACPEIITVGETPDYGAGAFMAKARYEYSPYGAEVWSEDLPLRPGEYEVRAVADSIIGTSRYGAVHRFKVVPKRVEVKAAETVVYGGLPEVYADLAYGDEISCTSFEYEDTALAQTRVTALEEGIRVYDRDGNDVTFSYTFSPVSSEIRFIKREAGFTVADAVFVYDGAEHSSNVFEVDAETPLAKGDRAVAEFSATRADAGESVNAPEIRIVREADGADVTHNYDIHITAGKLTVEKRRVEILTGSAEKPYDAAPLSSAECSVTQGSLVGGHTLAAVSVSSRTDAGESENIISLTVTDTQGRDVTRNYSFAFTYGTLKVTPKPLSGTARAEKIYDGAGFSGEIRVYSDGLTAGDTAYARATSAHTEAGVGGLEIEEGSFRAVNAAGEDVSGNYCFEGLLNGEIYVSPRPITVTAGDGEKEYDGTPLTADGVRVSSALAFALVEGHTVRAQTSGERTDAGTGANCVVSVSIYDGEREVTQNYDISLAEGALTVTPRNITVNTAGNSWMFDGGPHFDGGFEIIQGALVSGHELRLAQVTVIQRVGRVSNALEFSVYGGGRDVSANYSITRNFGVLEVTRRPVKFVSDDFSWVYDGAYHYDERRVYDVSPDSEYGLAENHVAEVARGTWILDAGTKENVIELRIYYRDDGVESEYTDCYEITYGYGTLEVTKRPVIFDTGSFIWRYDGRSHSYEAHRVCEESEYGVADGQFTRASRAASITDVGEKPNTMTIDIYERAQNDRLTNVTENYEISYLHIGTLAVSLDFGGGNLDQSGTIGGGSGGSGGGFATQTVAMSVVAQTNGKVYFRLKSFGDYRGRSFSEGVEYDGLLDGKYSLNYLAGAALGNRGLASSHISIEVYGSGYYIPYYPAALAEDYTVQTSDVMYAGEERKYALNFYSYDIVEDGRINNALPDGYAQAELLYRQFVREHYLSVPAGTAEYLQTLIDENGFNANSADIVGTVARFIRNAAEYSLSYDSALDGEEDIVVAFLRDYKRGVCSHYAAAATMLFRQLGIPARYVIGYVSDVAAGVRTDITTENAHGWVEVYIDGFGWAQAEVTGGGPGGNGGNGGNGGEAVEPKPLLTVRTHSLQKYYDGKPMYFESDDYYYDAGNGLTVTVTGLENVGMTSVGRLTPSAFEGVTVRVTDALGYDVTGEYTIVFETDFEISKRSITVSSLSTTKIYDGLPLTCGECRITAGSLAEGHTVYAEVTASVTDVGEVLNVISSVRISDENGIDVTENYDVKLSHGTLCVLPD